MRALRSIALLLAALAVTTCVPPDSTTPDPSLADDIDGKSDRVKPAAFTWQRAPTKATVSRPRPVAGQYRVHVVDVGTGLAILVQGSDFTMLYDGGSGDDRAGITSAGNGNRLLAYLASALGPSGPAACTPDGDAWEKKDRAKVRIDHVFLSHPHEDHDSLLDDVVSCYDVRNVWDSGDNNNREGYGKFMMAVAATSGVIYHNAAGRRICTR